MKSMHSYEEAEEAHIDRMWDKEEEEEEEGDEDEEAPPLRWVGGAHRSHCFSSATRAARALHPLKLAPHNITKIVRFYDAGHTFPRSNPKK